MRTKIEEKIHDLITSHKSGKVRDWEICDAGLCRVVYFNKRYIARIDKKNNILTLYADRDNSQTCISRLNILLKIFEIPCIITPQWVLKWSNGSISNFYEGVSFYCESKRLISQENAKLYELLHRHKLSGKGIENGIYIPHAVELFTFDEWMRQPHPEIAQTVVLVTEFVMLEIAKDDLLGEYNFEDAQKAAAEYREGFRCPTRHEANEIYDARFRGLDEALKKIGGKSATNPQWTSEADPDPKYSSYFAFTYNGGTGYVFAKDKNGVYSVRPVFAFNK